MLDAGELRSHAGKGLLQFCQESRKRPEPDQFGNLNMGLKWNTKTVGIINAPLAPVNPPVPVFIRAVSSRAGTKSPFRRIRCGWTCIESTILCSGPSLPYGSGALNFMRWKTGTEPKKSWMLLVGGQTNVSNLCLWLNALQYYRLSLLTWSVFNPSTPFA